MKEGRCQALGRIVRCGNRTPRCSGSVSRPSSLSVLRISTKQSNTDSSLFLPAFVGGLVAAPTYPTVLGVVVVGVVLAADYLRLVLVHVVALVGR